MRKGDYLLHFACRKVVQVLEVLNRILAKRKHLVQKNAHLKSHHLAKFSASVNLFFLAHLLRSKRTQASAFCTENRCGTAAEVLTALF